MCIVQIIQNTLTDMNLMFQQTENGDDRISFELYIAMRNGQIKSYIDVSENTTEIHFFAYCPFSIPENRRASMAQFLACKNHEWKFGRFYLSPQTGNINFSMGFYYDADALPSPVAVTRNLSCVISVMDLMFPTLMQELYAPTVPKTTADFWFN